MKSSNSKGVPPIFITVKDTSMRDSINNERKPNDVEKEETSTACATISSNPSPVKGNH